MARFVVLVGWSGGDWSFAKDLLERGQLPHLAGIINAGASGILRGFAPFDSAQLSATLVTGGHPDDVQAGLPCFWSELAGAGISSFGSGWAGVTDCIPEALRAVIAEPPGIKDLDPGLLGYFVSAEEVRNPNEAVHLQALLSWLAPVYRIHNASIVAAEAGIELVAAGYSFLHEVTQRFAPLRQEAVYSRVIAGAYRLMDALLGDLLSHSPPGCDVIVASDHGFSQQGAQAPYGLLAVRGLGVNPGDTLGPVALVDIVPTMLEALEVLPATPRRGRSLASRAAGTPSTPIPSPEIPATASATLALPIGRALAELDRPSEAALWLHHALLRAPESRVASYELSRALIKVGLIDEAAHFADAFLDAGENTAAALLFRAELALGRDDGKEALAWLARLGSGSVTSESEGFRRHALLKAGRGEEAETAFRGALEANPFEPLLLIGLGHAQLQNGNRMDARASLEAARRLAPEHGALAGLASALANSDSPSAPSWDVLSRHADARRILRERLERAHGLHSEQVRALRAGSSPVPFLSHALPPPLRTGPIVVVTGAIERECAALMRLMAQCGMPVMVDGARIPEASGGPISYRWAALKQLSRAPHLIDRAAGRAVLIPPSLLGRLPEDRNYAFVLVGGLPDAHLEKRGAVLDVPAETIRTDPLAAVSQVARFLGESRLRWPERIARLRPV